jgi:hypothetical protein
MEEGTSLACRSQRQRQFVSHVLGNVLGPSLFSVEGNDADRIVVLAGKEILNNGFQVRLFIVGFAPGTA